jgi:hypothetical protein
MVVAAKTAGVFLENSNFVERSNDLFPADCEGILEIKEYRNANGSGTHRLTGGTANRQPPC